jgi:glycine/D-amino acid oxidase-like deaminating enzyme
MSCRIRTPGPAPLLANSYGLRFAPWDFDYLIPRPDGSIIVGGGRSAYFLDKSKWYGNNDNSQGVNEVKRYFDKYMQQHFRGWENSGAYVDDIWTGSKFPFRFTVLRLTIAVL